MSNKKKQRMLPESALTKPTTEKAIALEGLLEEYRSLEELLLELDGVPGLTTEARKALHQSFLYAREAIILRR